MKMEGFYRKRSCWWGEILCLQFCVASWGPSCSDGTSLQGTRLEHPRFDSIFPIPQVKNRHFNPFLAKILIFSKK